MASTSYANKRPRVDDNLQQKFNDLIIQNELLKNEKFIEELNLKRFKYEVQNMQELRYIFNTKFHINATVGVYNGTPIIYMDKDTLIDFLMNN